MRTQAKAVRLSGRTAAAFAPLILAAALAVTLGGASPAAGQKPLDRTIVPPPGPAPELRVPQWTHTTLANGAELVVVAKRDLPLVSFSIDFIGGAANYEPAGKTGVAAFTADMLSEGTVKRTADELSEAEQMLGTEIRADVGKENGYIGFTALSDRFQPALALLADMLENPTFPSDALERLRGRTLVSLRQAKDRPNAIAADVFARVVYGAGHPYGRVMTEGTVGAITRDDIAAFHQTYFRPGHAVITVAGNVEPAAVKQQVEQALAGWKTGGAAPSFDYPAMPAPKPTTIYLVDKPNAAQSVFAIGLAGPPRDTPDYYAIEVMNTLLGGLFQSRLNHEIREVRGWSYGVGSDFHFGRGPGAFQAGGGVITAKSDSALMAFMRHLQGVRGEIPFTDDEMAQGKGSLVQSLPGRFASVQGTADAIGTLYTDALPETYYQDYAAKIDAVTRDDLVRVARTYLDLDHLSIVIVGDRATIEAPLRATGVAPITLLDVDGDPVTDQ